MTLELSEQAPGGQVFATSFNELPVEPSICVASNDEMWSDLLVRNLSARGASTVQCDLQDLSTQFSSIAAAGSWLVIDGGWPMCELQDAIEGLNTVLHESQVNSVIVVDELVGWQPQTSFNPDRIVNRTPDMRVLVRELISIFVSSSREKPESTG